MSVVFQNINDIKYESNKEGGYLGDGYSAVVSLVSHRKFPDKKFALK